MFETLRDIPILSAVAECDYLLGYGERSGIVRIPRSAVDISAFLSTDATYAAAANNTKLLQTALDAGIRISNTVPGTYYIKGSLYYPTGTRFYSDPRVEYRLFTGTNKCMLLPASWRNYLSLTTTTITWTAGAIANVRWTAHGLTTKDFVWLSGANQREYNNVFRVVNVVDADNFTVELLALPTTTPTGTTKGMVCTRDFIIEGGTWNYDRANNAAVADFNSDCFGIMGAANGIIRNCVFANFHRGITSGAIAHVRFSKNTYNGFVTGVATESHKTFGPANFIHIEDSLFRSTDDGSSVQPKETAASSWTGMPFGDIYHLTYENCESISSNQVASGGFVVYLSDNEVASDIQYINCRGYSELGAGFVVKYGASYSTGKAHSIRYQRCRGSTGTPASQYPISIAAPVDVVEIDAPSFVPGNLSNVLLRINTAAIVKVCTIRNMHFTNSTWPSSSAFMVSHAGICEVMKFENCFIGGQSNFNLFSCSSASAGALYELIFDNVHLNTASRLFQITSAVTQKHNIIVRNCYLKSVTSAFDMQSSAISRLTLVGNWFDTITNLVRPNTTAALVAQVFGSGNTLVSVTNVMAAANSATCEWYSWDLPIDVGVTGFVKTTSGQYAFNTSAGGARGTLVANRLVSCNGTNWLQLDTPANLF